MNNNTSTTRQTLRLFWQFTRDNPFLFWYSTLGAVAGVLAFDILPPLIVSQAFNHIQTLVAANQAVTLPELQSYFVLYVITVLSSIVIWRTEAYAAWLYMIKADQRIAEHLFNHVQRMGSRFHADRFGGALVSQITKFASAYNRFMSDFTWAVIPLVASFVATEVILAITSPLFTAVFTAVAALYGGVLYWRTKLYAPYNRRVASSESDRTAKIADTITNAATVRAFAGEAQEARLFHKQAGATYDAQMSLAKMAMRNELINQCGISVMNILAFSIGLLGVTRLDMPVGTLYLVVTYTMIVARRLWEAQFIMRNMSRTFGEAADMTEILQLEPEVKDPDSPEKSRIVRGQLTFKDVTFSYPDNQRQQLFKKLSFKIKPGEKIGLVGHSGGGKTTITQLLLRFMDIQEGQILIDDQDITKITQADLRAHIAYVPQEPLLFHRTLAQNIAYGKPGATKKEIIAAAKAAHAHEFIQDLPKGYDTLVGERGIKLSGGQRQRVAIARAMLKNAPILVLDEATSALDSESEKLIQDALWKLMQGRATIVIAHRLSTIQKMDRILVMEKGRIAEQGSHKELLRAKGTYASLWAHQSGGFLEE